jgi:phospholipid/cholesterol/gamma-HCH transport system substrate-binding protein
MKNHYVGLGIFVVVGTVLFALAIFLIGNQHSFFAKHVELYTKFKNLNGLAKGAKVRVGGFDAGEVADIGVPGSPSAGFRLKLQLNEQVRGLVRTDSVATIVTEGVVGDKVLLIGPGSPNSPEAPPFSELPSKDTSDIADLIQKSTTLVTDASGTMKVVADKLTAALDSVTTTVNNTNDVVTGIKQGRGTIGMLLRDEQTARDIRQTVANVRDAATSLNHASEQADTLISDFQSRGLPAKRILSRRRRTQSFQTSSRATSARNSIRPWTMCIAQRTTLMQLRSNSVRPSRKLSRRTRKAEMRGTTFERRFRM